MDMFISVKNPQGFPRLGLDPAVCQAGETLFWEQAVQRSLFNTSFLQVTADRAGEESVGSLAPCDPQLQLQDLPV